MGEGRLSILLVILLVLISGFACASDDAPPEIPAQYWGLITLNGGAAGNGLAVTAEVGGINRAQSSLTSGGYYNVILTGGDKSLTYDSDRTCATHWAAGQACVPCTSTADCIEGPQDGADIMIKVSGVGNMPWLDWAKVSNSRTDIVNPIGDWEKGGCVDMADFGFFANHYGETPASPGWNVMYDIIKDDSVDMADFGVFANHYNEGLCS